MKFGAQTSRKPGAEELSCYVECETLTTLKLMPESPVVQVVPLQSDPCSGRTHVDARSQRRSFLGAETQRTQLLRHLLQVRPDLRSPSVTDGAPFFKILVFRLTRQGGG